MRKSEREITDFADIIGVIEKCETIRIGINDGIYPYVVPVSFGYEADGGQITFYFHGAKEGQKVSLLSCNPHVCVEADRFIAFTDTGHSATCEYESFIGFGKAEKCSFDESVKGLDLLCSHCGISGYSGKDCASLGITDVYKIIISDFTGKRRVV